MLPSNFIIIFNLQNFTQVAKSVAKFLGKDLDEEALKKVAESATVKGMKKSYDEMEKNVPGGVFVAKAMGNKPFIHKGKSHSHWLRYFSVRIGIGYFHFIQSSFVQTICKEVSLNLKGHLPRPG